MSLATKVEIKYNVIKYVKKEDSDKDVFISYKTFLGIPMNCEFAFINNEDYDTFFAYFVKERYFIQKHETLTSFKAIRNYLIGLILNIALTIFAYYQALQIKNGTVEETNDYKTRIFNLIIDFLGDKGVIIVGALITLFLLYKIRARYLNPPDQTVLLPPNT